MEKVEVEDNLILTDGQKSLIGHCLAVFQQGIEMIERLDDVVYARYEAGSKSSIGAHFRHNLDFVTNFLRGLETGKIDYISRERNLRVETDREYAAARFRACLAELQKLSVENQNRKLFVRSETAGDLWLESSVGRELEFILSHTVHHYALMRMQLTPIGIAVPAEFGVAPSTLEFWKKKPESGLRRTQSA